MARSIDEKMKLKTFKKLNIENSLKIVFFVVLTLSSALFPSDSFAQTRLSQSTDFSKQIDELKNKVASKVAELKLVEKRGIIGEVTDVTDTQITVSDINQNLRKIDVDEFTKFSTPSATASFGISDVEKGQLLGVLGLYNKESKRTLARFVNVLEIPKTISGVIVDIDPKNFTLILATNKETITLNIENITSTYFVNEDGTMTKSGFSKLETKWNAVAVGFSDPDEKNMIIPSRLFVFPKVPPDPSITLPKISELSPGVVPSTGSGVKLTPIVE